MLARVVVGAARALVHDVGDVLTNPGALHIVQAVLFFTIIHMLCDTKPVQQHFMKLFSGNPSLSEKDRKRTCHLLTARVVGAVHNTIQIPLALYVLTDPAMTQGHVLRNQSSAAYLVMVISAGYFALDTICVIRNREPWLYTVHGAAACIGASWSVLNGWQQYYGSVFALYELSTYFVHLRWLLYKMGLAKSKLYFWNGILGMACFFLVRNVFGTYKAVQHFMLMRDELVNDGPIPVPMLATFALLNVTLNGLNAWWMYKMSQLAVRAMKGESFADATKGKEE